VRGEQTKPRPRSEREPRKAIDNLEAKEVPSRNNLRGQESGVGGNGGNLPATGLELRVNLSTRKM